MKFLAILAISTTLLLSAVDINNASKSELTTLSGIGAKKAEAVLAYRAKHCFKNVDDLTAVKGISTKTVEKNRAKLMVGKCKK
ncbi:helix-hairpin-helix domain-containing protein [Sulfurimonas sediminis]|uniref:Helix-hairpin-helix domain-containing protein n=1 Tax=Sulfurimonas sediminis TaxID=2590020 RepID=A0A7M1B3D1_9BACT|nr:helix-hairpin-helix domain-containing protein [Sulfurimonas sediminis]QOP43218.1 helix-hairpin-helix domain-containing protein [Sulfurimonas sediminis]